MIKRFGVTVIMLLVFVFSFQTLLAAPPSNDNFADAKALQNNAYIWESGENATTEIGENPCASDHSLWYKFTLAAPTKIAIGAADHYGQAVVRVGLYSNESVLTLLDCDDGVGDTDENDFELPDLDIRASLSAGTYYVQVGSTAGNSVGLRFELAPENDDIANAADLSLPANRLTGSWSATSEPGEGGCASGYSVWYKFTLPENMRIQVYAHAASYTVENFSALVGIYRADDLQTPVVCEQNQPNFPDAFFKRQLNAGDYYLQFGSNSPKQFYLLLLYSEPENDDFADALKLTEEGGFAAAALATVETGEDMYGSLTCGGRLYHTVWYKFKLKQPTIVDLRFQGDLLLNPDGSNPPRNLYYIDLWQKSGSGKIPLACDNVDFGEIRRELAPGTYYVRLASKAKLNKILPSYYSLGATFEPPGLPAIYDQPDRIHTSSGLPAVLSAAAHSTTPMTYQWYKAYDSGDTSDPVEGATDPVLVIPSATAANYWVRITNVVGFRDSETGSVSISETIRRWERAENGGFEDGVTGWTVTNPTNDKVVCESITKPAQGNGSACAFLFQGSAGENSSLRQSYSLPAAEDFLDLAFWMKNTAGAGKLQVRVTVKYSDIANQVVKLRYRPQNVYTRLSATVSFQSNSPESVDVRFIHNSPAGKTFIDDVSIVTINASWTRAGTDALPPPPALDGFRNNN